MSARKSRVFLNKLFKTKGKKLILVAPRLSAFRIPVLAALKEVGFEVYEFDSRKTTLSEKIFFAFSIIIKKNRKTAIQMLNRRLLKFSKKINPSVVFVSKGELINKDTIQLLKKLNIITINWYTDLFESRVFFNETLPAYDFIFTADSNDVKKYKKKMNVFHLPYGGKFLKKNPNFEKRSYNLVFIGSWTQEREDLLYTLQKFQPFIWGSKKWGKGKLKKFYQGSWLEPNKILEIYQNTKIAINEHQQKGTNTTLNLRVFEATANGALVITDFRGDLPKLFQIKGKRKELILFRNPHAAMVKIDYFLKKPNERIKIAKNGFQKTYKHYSYQKRIDEIFFTISKVY